MRLTSYANIAPPGSIYTPGQIATAPTPTPTSRNRSLPSVGPTASFNPSATAGKKSVSSGAIAGITAGCIAGIAALASLVWFLWRRQQRSRTSRSSPRSQSTHGGVGGAVVPEKQTQESNGMGWFQRKRYYSTQEGQGTRKPELNEHNMDDNGKIIPADATTSTRQDTSQANAGLGITAHRSSPPFSPASFHPASCNTNGFSITNGPPSPLPPSSTVDGRFNTDVGSAAPALELESRQQIVEADTVAGAAGGGALSPPTPRTVNNRGSQYTTAGASMLAPSVSGTISPPSDSPNLGQSRQPSQRSPPSGYQAYRIAQGDGVGRGPSLTSATGYTGFKYASPEDMMQHGWKNDPEPE